MYHPPQWQEEIGREQQDDTGNQAGSSWGTVQGKIRGYGKLRKGDENMKATYEMIRDRVISDYMAEISGKIRTLEECRNMPMEYKDKKYGHLPHNYYDVVDGARWTNECARLEYEAQFV